VPAGTDSVLEDVHHFFGSAQDASRSPEPDVAAGSKQPERTKTTALAKKSTKPVPTKRPRFSIPGQVETKTQSRTNSARMGFGKTIDRVLKEVKNGELPEMSPSDLSNVSIAPPSPAPVAVPTQKNNHVSPTVVTQDTEINLQQHELEISSKDASIGEEEDTRQETNLKHSAEETARLDAEVDEEAVGEHLTLDEDDESEFDDLVPPPPPQDEPESTQESNSNDFEEEFPVMQHDDDDDDDDKEGEGFQMADLEHHDNSGARDDDEEDDKEGEGFQMVDSENHDNTDEQGDDEGDDKEEEGFPVVADDDDESRDGDHDGSNGVSEVVKAGERKEQDAELNDDNNESARTPKTPRNSEMENDEEDQNDDDDDDDNKEGHGFNMVHDPETPRSVREKRARDEEEELKQGRKKKKKQKQSPMRSDDASEMGVTPKAIKKGKKKKRVRLVEPTRFSPEGYAVGNRTFSEQELHEIKKDPTEEAERLGVRRSKRASYKPLQYWKNERVAYGPTDEDGLLGEAMGNMPEVKKVLRANPTPRKVRAATAKKPKGKSSKSKKKGRDSDYSSRSLGDTPFDDTKLRQRYDFMEGEDALIWDDDLKEATEQSELKCLFLTYDFLYLASNSLSFLSSLHHDRGCFFEQ